MNIQKAFALLYINMFLILFRNYYVSIFGMFFTYIYYVIDTKTEFFEEPETFEHIKDMKHKKFIKKLQAHLHKIHKTHKN